MELQLNDALTLIQRAEESIAANKNSHSYGEMLGSLIEKFKNQLSQDFQLPLTYLEPVDLDVEQEKSSDEEQQPENPALTAEAERLYRDIDMSI